MRKLAVLGLVFGMTHAAVAQPIGAEAVARQHVQDMRALMEARTFCVAPGAANAELIRNMRTTEEAVAFVFSTRVRDVTWSSWAQGMTEELRRQVIIARRPSEPCMVLLDRFQTVARATGESLAAMMPAPADANRDQH